MDANKEAEILQALKSSPKIKNDNLRKGDKVKIDIEKYRYQKDAGSITEIFWKFLEDNKDTIFTIFPRNKNNVLWGIEEDTRWSLYADFLIKIS